MTKGLLEQIKNLPVCWTGRMPFHNSHVDSISLSLSSFFCIHKFVMMHQISFHLQLFLKESVIFPLHITFSEVAFWHAFECVHIVNVYMHLIFFLNLIACLHNDRKSIGSPSLMIFWCSSPTRHLTMPQRSICSHSVQLEQSMWCPSSFGTFVEANRHQNPIRHRCQIIW